MSTIAEAKPIPDSAVEQVTLRLKGEYRRVCLWMVLGVILVGLLSIFVRPEQPWKTAAGFAVVLVASIVLWLYVQTWRLRIDSTGLARRRLGVWSSWTWDLFSAGGVCAESQLAFRCAARPWWDRWLTLEFAEPEAAAAKLARFLRALLPPPPAEAEQAEAVAAPAEVAIGLGFSGRLQLTPQGIEFQRRRESRWLTGDDVLILRLIRERNQQAIMHRLELQLRAGETISGAVRSVRIDGRRIWTIGDRRADWPQRLASLVPPRCWQVFQTAGDLQSRAEGEFRLAYWRKKLTMMRRFRTVLPPLFLVLCGMVFVPKLIVCWNTQFIPPWMKAVALVCLALVMVQPSFMLWGLAHYNARVYSRKLDETDTEMSRFPATEDTPVASE